jgi:hypothetical protein
MSAATVRALLRSAQACEHTIDLTVILRSFFPKASATVQPHS